jgi:AraC-like DNA-binding protein
MYPIKLENDAKQQYFSDEEFFLGGFHFIHSYLHKDYDYKMHSHQFYEMNIIAAGNGFHYIENTVIPAAVGDVFVIPPGVSHGYFSYDNVDIYHVLIKSDFLSRYSEELSEVSGYNVLFDIEPQIRRVSGKNLNLKLGHKEMPYFRDELEKMIRVESEGRYVYLNALTLALICRLCRRITRQVTDSDGANDIIAAMEYIKNNVEAKLTLANISEVCNMSKATLNRRFNESVGMSPMNYVLSCRIAKARELLAEGVVNKTEIANICGFYDTAHMNKYIK